MRIRWSVVTLLVGIVAFASPAAAAECPPGEGTTVVVDFGDLGGGVVVGCASTAGTGFEALDEAGFEVDVVASNPAFVCRIDGRPGSDVEDCADIPPESAFWSYWSAEHGGEWRFNVTGASGAIAGDVEGWAFATGTASPPRHAVPAAPTTTSTTTTTTTTTSTSTTTTTTTTTQPTTTTASTTSSTPTSTTTTTTASTTTPSSTVPTTTPTSTAPTTTRPSPTLTTVEAADAAEGSAGGFVAGGLAVAAIGAASWLIARRRSGAA